MNKQLIGYILLGIFAVLALVGGIVLVIVKNNENSGGNCNSKICKFPHGKCEQNKCICEAGWSGEDCLTPSNKCDSTKCLSPKGTCNDKGICECAQNYGGENCLTECQDNERSILCVNNLSYKCCDSSINSCDINNNCCENGLKEDKKTCDVPWTCKADGFDDLGKCSSGNCPKNWCPDMNFIFCTDDKIVKNRMYLFTNMGTETYKFYKRNCSDPRSKPPDKCADESWALTRKTCLGPNSNNLDMPDYINFCEKRANQPGYENINPDSYAYIDDNRPNKTLDECPFGINSESMVSCSDGKGGIYQDKVCAAPLRSSPGKYFSSVYADPSYIWSLQKYKYMQFEPNKPNSLLFQICNMFTKSFSCVMTKNNIIPNNNPSVCIGMGPRSGPFPDPKTQLGTFFSFSKENQFFPLLPNNSDYGSWTEGVPWVEFEQPICGGMVDDIPSKLRNTNFPDGCTTQDGKITNYCGAQPGRVNGSYMFVRVQNPDTKEYYRFYLGSPPNLNTPPYCKDGFKDEYDDPIGGCFNSSGNDEGTCIYGNYCSQRTLFFFTEDIPFGLEKYLSAEACTKTRGKKTNAGVPYCWPNAGGNRNQLELFLWDNSEINPLPPNSQDAWQKNSIDFAPNCNISTCNLSSTFWVSPVENKQGDQGLYCHNINAEKAPDLNWDKITPQHADKMTPMPSEVKQPTPAVYYSQCTNGSQVYDSDICDLYSLSTSQMNKNIDGICNVSGQDFCQSGIKEYSYNKCKSSSVTDLYYLDDNNNCVKNTDGTKKDKKDLYPDKYCNTMYKCSSF